MNIKAFIRNLLHKLFHIKDNPHSISLGAAIGVFIGFIPLFGLKTLIALFSAFITRSNKIAAVIAVTLHDITLPLLPFMLNIEYKIGCRTLGFLKHQNSLDLINRAGFIPYWTEVLNRGAPILIGSIFLAIPFGITSYFIMKKILNDKHLEKNVSLNKIIQLQERSKII